MSQPYSKPVPLSELLTPDALHILSASGNEFVKQVGLDVVRGVVLDVMGGKNLRDATESLTRRRLAMLNLEMIALFLRGVARSESFVENLPHIAEKSLSQPKITHEEKWLSYWALGLTDKAFQNVLRDSSEGLATYRDRYIEVCREVIEDCSNKYGNLTGQIELGPGLKANIDWLLMIYLLEMVGAQTLTIRGSEKSAYGKLFEKLILGSLLHVLGFKYVSAQDSHPQEKVFWLSSRSAKRESDATLLYRAGKGVRFDIGFIGRGNPEITLDKVTRFEHSLSLGHSHWYMGTIIIVDRVGEKSNIEELARQVGGTIIQMSAGYWPQQVARELQRVVGFDHALVNMDQDQIGEFLAEQIKQVPFEAFLSLNNESA